MPYGNDEWLKKIERDRQAAERRNASARDIELRLMLKINYQVPDEFMDLAVRIWWDGKED